ncbi:hypothetical protein T492DRAFT_1068712 [Pavlovales sp. CCMP2436]|nr:hypothetical protein T492DRAFT_1068712 [Pavlovales sp. CCMP2436]
MASLKLAGSSAPPLELTHAMEDLRAGQTLLQRYEEGKKTLRPEVAEAGIMVLDSLIARLKNVRSNSKKTVDDRLQEIKHLDKQIETVAPYYNKNKKMHDAHVKERDQLVKDVAELTVVLDNSVKASHDLLYTANRAAGLIRTNMASSLVDSNRGFTASGAALAGRETNALKRTGGVKAANTRAAPTLPRKFG